jgi:heat shock protein HslJ
LSRPPVARNPRAVLSARTAGVLLAGCLMGSGCGGPAAGSVPDPTGEWELVQLWRGSTVEPEPVGGRATLDVGDGTVSGTAYCNRYSGTFRLDGDALAVEGLGSTEMACPTELMTAEAAYLEALGGVERLGSSDGYLVLTGPDVELRFRTVPPVPTSELAGTRWVLETLLDGEVASSTTGRPAELELATDGTFTGSTGCRGISGSWSLDGDVVRVTGFAASSTGCAPDVAAQDGQVAGVLAEAFQVSVTGDSLTVTGPDGLGLVYRAG